MEGIDVLFSFDTTGSMYPCLTQVRRYVEETVKLLFAEIPDIRVAVVTHGDYCDGKNFMTTLDFTTDQAALCRFVKSAPATYGGDAPEAYEAVLNKARSLSWAPSGRKRAMVLIGDDVPHEKTYRPGYGLDWKLEADALASLGVSVYGVQALGNRHATKFYQAVSEMTGGVKLDLQQFADITPLLKAVCFRQAGNLDRFRTLMAEDERANPRVVRIVDLLAGRPVLAEPARTEHSLHAVHPSRFQVLKVDRDCSIKEFVEENTLAFRKGRGFYEFSKSVKVQSYKEVVVEDRATGEMFTGDKARELLGIPVGRDAQAKPGVLGKYRGFIQSTSSNRKLLGGTRFLYEVEGLR